MPPGRFRRVAVQRRLVGSFWRRTFCVTKLALFRLLPHSQDWTLQLRQVLHCDPRLLSVGGGGGFLRWCMAYPALGAIPLGSHGAVRECFRRAASNPA